MVPNYWVSGEIMPRCWMSGELVPKLLGVKRVVA